jgi:hypothetical protein
MKKISIVKSGEIKNLKNASLSPSKISEKIGVSKMSVFRILKNYKIILKKPLVALKRSFL